MKTATKTAMKEEMVLAALARWGGSWTTAQIASRIREEEVDHHGHPIGLTGGVYIPPWGMYVVLSSLLEQGKVRRRKVTPRVIFWRAVK